MNAPLLKYEAACLALAECRAVDEVKTWADKAAAMQAYGRMANDKTLELDASEIRLRAERRLGELLAAQKAGEGLNRGAQMTGNKAGAGQGSPAVVADDRRPKLADAGISKDLSSRAQKLAAVPAGEFEAALAEKREAQSREGARVTARLLKRGAEKLAEDEDEGPSAQEMAEAAAAERDDAERVRVLLDSDEPLKAMTERCAQLQAEVRILKARVNGLTNEAAQAVRLAKNWRLKFEKLERAAA